MLDTASLAEEIVHGKGYVLLPELFTQKEISEARLQILQLAAEQPAGRFLNAGKRLRLYRLLEEAEIFEQMVQHPKVIEVVEAILGSDMTLGGFSAHILYPGANNMGAHVDYPYFTMTPPYPTTPVMEVQAIWMMEDFTETNGAPLFAANTQKLCQFPNPEKFAELAHQVTGAGRLGCSFSRALLARHIHKSLKGTACFGTRKLQSKVYPTVRKLSTADVASVPRASKFKTQTVTRP